MVGTKKTEEEAEIVEQDSLMAMKNLLRIAIYNISYIRGIFPEDYFRDDNVPESELMVKKLVPKDVESRRLIDWIEEGVYDAVQKNYVETVLFCICEKDEGATIEEYSFKFRYPDTSHEDAAMEFILTGSRVNGAMFKSNAAESSADQIRRLIRVSATMMSSLNPIPDERTVQIKLMYYDDVTPGDYEPPLFQSCLDEDDHKDLAQLFGRLCCISERVPILLVDSGATHHICCDKSYFTEMKKIDKQKQIVLYTADGTEVKAKKAGLIDYGTIHLNQIHYVPSLNFNVVSIGYLDKQGLLISIANNELFIIDVNKSIHVGEGYRHRKNNDYILKAMNWVVQTEVELQLDELLEEEEEEEEISEMWVVDSGCASHMTGNFAMLSNPKPVDEEFQVPRGRMKATHKGTVSNKNVKLSDVRYCPGSTDNLISVGVLDSQGHRFIFYNGVCTIVCKETLTEVGRAKLDNSNLLYYLKTIEIRNVISKRGRNRGSRRNKA